jgi:alkyl hydroperoxide reductase subunit AhpF
MILPNVMLLTSYDCTPCLRIKRMLNELQAEMPNLCIQEVEFKSVSGSRLSIENNVLYPPAVFLNGKLLVKGKIDAEKMIAAIRERRQDA